jgi:hypothetical protein
MTDDTRAQAKESLMKCIGNLIDHETWFKVNIYDTEFELEYGFNGNSESFTFEAEKD